MKELAVAGGVSNLLHQPSSLAFNALHRCTQNFSHKELPTRVSFALRRVIDVCSEKGCISRRSSSLTAVTSQPLNGVDTAAKPHLSPSQAILKKLEDLSRKKRPRSRASKKGGPEPSSLPESLSE
ncbi:uncharacterized protein G2W53_000650 [Senna tora]|uniref:Uncharacterized protein n=1 Tax=Senna tora TaxID=362788 RepID=A0A834XE41_9FABA|nr:uncharacterized protein G2W53_000650 [Senna tora]